MAIISHILFAVYVDMGADGGDTATIMFSLSGAVMGNRMWDIKVTQVSKDSIIDIQGPFALSDEHM